MADTKRWVPKVNRHVVVQVKKTVGGNTQYLKRRPGIITALATDTNPVIRVGHSGETYGTASVGVVRQIDYTVPVIGTSPGRTVGSAARDGLYIGG